jgi:hypothetical protein
MEEIEKYKMEERREKRSVERLGFSSGLALWFTSTQ